MDSSAGSRSPATSDAGSQSASRKAGIRSPASAPDQGDSPRAQSRSASEEKKTEHVVAAASESTAKPPKDAGHSLDGTAQDGSNTFTSHEEEADGKIDKSREIKAKTDEDARQQDAVDSHQHRQSDIPGEQQLKESREKEEGDDQKDQQEPDKAVVEESSIAAAQDNAFEDRATQSQAADAITEYLLGELLGQDMHSPLANPSAGNPCLLEINDLAKVSGLPAAAAAENIANAILGDLLEELLSEIWSQGQM